MATFNIPITNGTGQLAVAAGTYTATVSATGYDDTTLSPTSYTATTAAGTGNFTVTATGTLTFNVNETGAAGGTPITGGTIIMTNATGTTDYGTAQTISATGVCTFNNVPFGTSGTPYILYFRQLTSDSTHNIESSIITVNMTSNAVSQFIQNTAIALQTFNLSDATYTGLPVNSATLTLNN